MWQFGLAGRQASAADQTTLPYLAGIRAAMQSDKEGEAAICNLQSAVHSWVSAERHGHGVHED